VKVQVCCETEAKKLIFENMKMALSFVKLSDVDVIVMHPGTIKEI
jgi:hypothetical protein